MGASLAALIGFERARLAALIAQDLELALTMHHVEFELVTPRGFILSRAEYLEEIRSGGIRYLEWLPSRMVGRVAGGTGALRYRSRMETESDGQRLPTLHCWHTDYYEHDGRNWQAVFSQATAIA